MNCKIILFFMLLLSGVATSKINNSSLLNILDSINGFGDGQINGGETGTVYHVTNLNDSGPGSLRSGAESDKPLWILFDVSGTIQLESMIQIKSNKTIDGRNAKVTIKCSEQNKGRFLFRIGNRVKKKKYIPVVNVVISDLLFEGVDKRFIKRGRGTGISIGYRSKNILVRCPTSFVTNIGSLLFRIPFMQHSSF